MPTSPDGGAKRTLVLGANGQDGSYLVEILLRGGARVTGVARQGPRWTHAGDYRHVAMDIGDEASLARLLQDIAPEEIYHVAAIHGAAGFSYEPVWQQALRVNTGAVQVCLEHMRTAANACALFYASSLKAFGERPPALVDEHTPLVSSCLYSITKNASSELINYYRRRHGVRASIAYLFNHDSPRRGAEYFLPRLVRKAAAALGAAVDPGAPLASLDFYCDWGSSAEFMAFAVDVLRAPANEDYVFASGVTWRAFDLVQALASAVGLPNTDWLDVVSPPGKGPPPAFYQARLDRLRANLGRVPRMDALQTALWILREQYGMGAAGMSAPR